VERIEAIAIWTEMLRDTLSAAAGLEQAVLATAAIAPPAIAEPVGTCAARIRSGAALTDALYGLGDDLGDPTGDLVVAALTMAATRQARHLSDLLSSLARAARDQVVMRLRVAAGRARIRASVRIILGVTGGMVTALVLLNRGYLAAYDTASGQLVLLSVGVIFAACFLWLDKIGTIPVESRLLTARPSSPGTGSMRSADGGKPVGG
jgi:Flp pilus assembly protein TadB